MVSTIADTPRQHRSENKLENSLKNNQLQISVRNYGRFQIAIAFLPSHLNMRVSRVGRLYAFHDALRLALQRSRSTSPANNRAVVQRTPRILKPYEGARPQVQHAPSHGYSSFAHQSHTRILERDAHAHDGRVKKRRSRVGPVHRSFANESSRQVVLRGVQAYSSGMAELSQMFG